MTGTSQLEMKIHEQNEKISKLNYEIKRIDELEAKLAKAVEALYKIAGKPDYADDPWEIAHTALADLKENLMDRNDMINELRKRDCRVIFKKANGEERDMICTLREDAIPASSADNNTEPKTSGYSDTAIRVIDVNKGEWRAFRVDSVVSFS